jgi:hypothetical protein
MKEERGSKAAIAEILRIGKKISVDEMAGISKMAEEAGGLLVSVAASEDDDDWCGNGIIRFPWPPPKREALFILLEKLVEMRVNWEVLINGTPVPLEVMVQVSRRQFGQ